MYSSTPFVLSFALLLSLPILFLLAPKILPPRPLPISLPDELDDLSLFHKATIAYRSPNPKSTNSISHLSTTTPPPKIAFMFLTNSDIVFSPLWEKFFDAEENNKFYNIYIHADPTTKFSTPLSGVFKDRTIPSKRTERGSPTLISAARRLLATAVIDDPQNMYFALISQSCIPLHSFRYFYRSVFTPYRDPTESSRTWLTRLGDKKYRSFIEILDSESTLPDRYKARGENVMMPEVSFEQFRVGSQFFILTRKHALMVIKDRRLWRKFRLPCLNIESCYPEEHYFPTLLSMEDPKGCTHFTLTRVNWTDSVDGHPHTYQPDEVSAELIYRLRVSNSSYSYLLARKFSPETLPPLMDMADTVIFRD